MLECLGTSTQERSSSWEKPKCVWTTQCQRHRRWYQKWKNFKLTHYQARFGCRNKNQGRDLGSVVGKTNRQTPETVVIEHAEPMVDKRIILCIDLYFIVGLTFLLSVTAQKAAVESQVSAYKSRDYYVTYILNDNESAISAAISSINEMGVVINQTAKNEHVPEVERAGMTLKERVRAVWNTLPYKLTNEMIVGLTYYACKMVNMFPKANRIGGFSPKELFTGVKMDYKRISS